MNALHRTDGHRLVRIAGQLIVCCLVAAAFFVADADRAGGVSTTARFTVTATPAGAGMYATYTLDWFSTANNETVTRVAVTFPAGCDVTAATAVQPGDTIISRNNNTVVLQFGTPKGPSTNFIVEIGNVRNPMTPGTYSLVNPIVFTRSNGQTQNLNLQGRRGDFTIAVSPYMVLSITTPDEEQSVNFGTVDPGATTAPRTVRVTVDSSIDFAVTKSLSGQHAQMGLATTALPHGPQIAGIHVYNDAYSLTPAWTTDPGPYSAHVVYTVVAQ